MVALATLATVIASQAVISGAYSITRQAIQLGYCPRLEIRHTSASTIGQIYVPTVNWLLMLATIGLVLGFRSSSALAAAYGVAVTTTMAITTVLLAVVAHERWGWKSWQSALLVGAFLGMDLAFFGANILKVPHGGWFPLVVAAIVLTLMTTWWRGRQLLNQRMAEGSLPLDLFLPDLAVHPPVRVPGTAVFMSRGLEGVPPALLHNLKHNKVLHERVVFLTVTSEERPLVRPRDRVQTQDLGHGIHRVILRYGFMEDPDVPEVLAAMKPPPLEFKPDETTYFLGKETLFATKSPGMALWRERLFALMSRNARSATSFFRLPPNRVIELGAQIEL
jgi:KUP system potassium uptake protein